MSEQNERDERCNTCHSPSRRESVTTCPVCFGEVCQSCGMMRHTTSGSVPQTMRVHNRCINNLPRGLR
jgi:hypothetical protein